MRDNFRFNLCVLERCGIAFRQHPLPVDPARIMSGLNRVRRKVSGLHFFDHTRTANHCRIRQRISGLCNPFQNVSSLQLLVCALVANAASKTKRTNLL